MSLNKHKTGLLALLISVFSITFSGAAFAHVTVSPAEVLTATRTTFAVSVPNEHDTSVVKVRLVIPEGLESVRPFAKAGWEVSTKSTGEGEEKTVTEITWTGGEVPVDLKDEFQFGALTPDANTELKWKAYETYADGKTVGWDQEPSDEEGSKPYSVTKIVSETAATTAVAEAEQAAADAQSTADLSTYMAGAAIVVGLVGIFLATRKN